MTRPETVYLVGAGPGDPDLITIKGVSCLQNADVVVYDRLANPALLEHVSIGTQLINVGKRPGQHRLPQDEINCLLIEKARQGNRVVRLKGGDPFVFGRGGEEAQVLAQAGIPCEVVPGVSSALAVPAYAGIPITHRHVAQSFTVVSGHTCQEGDPLGIDWDDLPKRGTLVILMGARHLAEITGQLITVGRPPETPAATIRWGTTPDQEIITGTLANIAEKAKGVQPPVIITIGDVVKLHDQIHWFDPLVQKTITIENSATKVAA